MKKIFLKYKFFIILAIFVLLMLIFHPQVGSQSLVFTGKNFISFLFMLTPIFICIGLLDVWVEREMLIKIMGKKSGVEGILIAFLLGLVTAVPLYALLPIAGILLKKGSKLSNVLIFLCSSTNIRIPLLLFIASSMGWKYTLLSFILNIFVVIAIAYTIEKVLTDNDKKLIYSNANKLYTNQGEDRLYKNSDF
ncbi:Predicted permease [Anaerovirgula multivorans]|uniref:Predicted permease n=1 Tax=Anaerovirgula multivorans TaxID=312168 RepID=A0A239F8U8_9FIRM|nr:permease [Anaerovirgula multivorans]SNS52582.1 Predicted permease [Anaerovirgula multivorans]